MVRENLTRMKFLVFFFITEITLSVCGQADIVLDLIEEAAYNGEAH